MMTSESSSWSEMSGVNGRAAPATSRFHAAPEVGSDASSLGETQM